MKPALVTKKHEQMLLEKIATTAAAEAIKRPKPVHIIKMDDKVRISKYKKTFVKGYLPKTIYKQNVFTVYAIVPTNLVKYFL